MLPAGPQVKDVFLNPKTGILASPSSGKSPKFFIECSTIDVPSSAEVATAVKSVGAGKFVDAPVSGGTGGAEAGTLTFMIGGEEDEVTEIMPIVKTMGTQIFHCGKQTAGLSTKQINNHLSGITMIATAEAMNLGNLCGLNPKILAGVINASTGMCYNSREQNPVNGVSPTSTSSKDFAPGFTIELCKGVLHMAVNLGKEKNANMPLAQTTIDLYETAAKDDRCAGKDYRSIYKFVADIQ